MSLKDKLQSAADPANLVRKKIDDQLLDFNTELDTVDSSHHQYAIIDTSAITDTSGRTGSFKIVQGGYPLLKCETTGSSVAVKLMKYSEHLGFVEDTPQILSIEEAVEKIEDEMINALPARVRDAMFSQTDAEAEPITSPTEPKSAKAARRVHHAVLTL